MYGNDLEVFSCNSLKTIKIEKNFRRFGENLPDEKSFF